MSSLEYSKIHYFLFYFLLDVLMKGGLLDKALLITEIERVMHKHRKQNYCQQIIDRFTLNAKR